MLQEAEVKNYDAGLTAYSRKINEEDDKMSISMEEYQKTVEYQEALKVDAKNISKKKTKNMDSNI